MCTAGRLIAAARGSLAAALCMAGAAAPLWPAGSARAEEPTALEDVVQILQRAGKAKESDVQRVAAKEAGEQKSSVAKRFEKTQFSADFLVRYESFFFDQDLRGIDGTNRTRFQYRLRVGLAQQLSDRIKVGFRLASGAPNARSTNTSFGEGVNDGFTPDGIFFDRAFLEYKLQNTMAAQSQIVVGKTANPFLAAGPDFLLFDSDLSLEGAFVSGSYRPTETTRVYGALGGFVLDEIADGSDPKLVGGQLGFDTALSQILRVGLRASGYQFRGLNPTFQMTGMQSGNLSSAFDDGARIGETYAFAQLALSELWPLLIFGQAVKNFTAERDTIGGFRLGAEDTSYGFGVTMGNPVKLLQFGLAYYRAEANAFPAQFPDGATFDTVSNREGILAFAARRINPLLEMRLSYSDIEEIRNLGGVMGPFGVSAMNADRKRIVADLVFTF